jgi:hypothetical protein
MRIQGPCPAAAIKPGVEEVTARERSFLIICFFFLIFF